MILKSIAMIKCEKCSCTWSLKYCIINCVPLFDHSFVTLWLAPPLSIKATTIKVFCKSLQWNDFTLAIGITVLYPCILLAFLSRYAWYELQIRGIRNCQINDGKKGYHPLPLTGATPIPPFAYTLITVGNKERLAIKVDSIMIIVVVCWELWDSMNV